MNEGDFIPHEPSYTVDEFCAAERISRVRLYELWKLGHGPRFYLNGRCRRITHAARADWQSEMESRVKTQEGTNAAGQRVRELTLAAEEKPSDAAKFLYDQRAYISTCVQKRKART